MNPVVLLMHQHLLWVTSQNLWHAKKHTKKPPKDREMLHIDVSICSQNGTVWRQQKHCTALLSYGQQRNVLYYTHFKTH